jgi:hypothetical protein
MGLCCGISPCGVPRPSLAAYVAGTGPRARRTPPESASVGYPLYCVVGKMLQETQGFMGQAPGMAVFPGVAIALSVLTFNMLGDDGLRDLLDPRLR